MNNRPEPSPACVNAVGETKLLATTWRRTANGGAADGSAVNSYTNRVLGA